MTRSQPVLRIEEHPEKPANRAVWPATVPAVRQLLDEGLDLGAMTILVGDNGAGKSTLVEAMAMAFGLNAEGGTTNVMHRTRRSESSLAEHLRLVRGAGASRRGFFLRAETMHGLFTYLDELGGEAQAFHERSHGESFLDIVESRSRVEGLWVFDEPESALSLPGCLALIGHIADLLADDSQVVLSTHSPVLAAFPGAAVYEIGEWGIRRSDYDDLDLVRTWRSFLDGPDRFLRHVL